MDNLIAFIEDCLADLEGLRREEKGTRNTHVFNMVHDMLQTITEELESIKKIRES